MSTTNFVCCQSCAFCYLFVLNCSPSFYFCCSCSSGSVGSVSVGGSTCTPLGGTGNYQDGQIKCVLPAGEGVNQTTTVLVAGQLSNAALYSYAGPWIKTFSPATSPAEGGTLITITGTRSRQHTHGDTHAHTHSFHCTHLRSFFRCCSSLVSVLLLQL